MSEILFYTEARGLRLLLARLFLCPVLAFAVAGAQSDSTQGNTAQNAANQSCVVTGEVSSSLTGEPLRKAAVQLIPHGVPTVSTEFGVRSMDPSGSKQTYSTISQADGSFFFDNVKPGDYLLAGQRNGYLSTQYGAKRPMSSGTVLTLAAGQQKNEINLALIPQAVITGKVIDEDGDPLSGVMVQAIRQQWMQGKMSDMVRAGTQTNDLGEFRLSGIAPGKFYLVAQKMNFEMMDGMVVGDSEKPTPHPVRTYYPEALTREAAAPLEMQAGQDLAGIDIRMHSALTYHVRGKVAGLPSDKDSERTYVSVRPLGDSSGATPGSQAMVGKAHTFDIPGVTPGNYQVTLRSTGGKASFLGRQEVEVGNGDLNDVVLNAQTPASLRGRVQWEGDLSGKGAGVDLGAVRIHLTPVDFVGMAGLIPNATPGNDGTFTLENVLAGKYNLMATAPSGAYVQSIRLGGQELLGKHLDFGNGVSGELEIFIHFGPAQVKGTVSDSEHSGANAGAANALTASVLLAPADPNEDGSGLKFDSTDASGNFTIRQLPPGRYKAYAFESATLADLQNPDVLKQLEGKGTDLEVKENESKQIQLPLISASDFEQVLAKLGLDPEQ